MISLDDCFNHYKGLSVLVDGNPADQGQCVQWADVVLAEVYGDVTHYGNAIDWWNDPGDLLTDGFEKITDGSIKKGDFVIYDGRVGSAFGHIDVAAWDGTTKNYLGYDSNWGHNLTVHEVQHNDNFNNYILGSLRLKGEDFTMTEDEAKDLYRGLLHREPENDKVWRTWVGKHYADAYQAFCGGTEWLTQNDVLKRAYPALQQQVTELEAEIANGGNDKAKQILADMQAVIKKYGG